MPGFDRTGPGRKGFVTEGGRGFCGNPDGAKSQLADGRGSSGRCGGRGWRNTFHATGLPRWQRRAFWNAPATEENVEQALKSEADFLRSRLQALEERLAAMRAENK